MSRTASVQSVEERIQIAKRHAHRVREEVRHAVDCWAALEHLHKLRTTDKVFDKALECNFPSGLRKVCDALFAETVATLMRAIDQPGNDRISLCTIACCIRPPEVQQYLLSDAWVYGTPAPGDEQYRIELRRHQEIALARFSRDIPNNWTNCDHGGKSLVKPVRTALRPMRDKLLSHSQAVNSDDISCADAVRKALSVVGNNAARIDLIFFRFDSEAQYDLPTQVSVSGEVWKDLYLGSKRRYVDAISEDEKWAKLDK